VAGVAEALVADLSGSHGCGTTGRASDRGGAGEGAKATGRAEATVVVPDLGEHPGRQNGTEARSRSQHSCQGVLVELKSKCSFEALDRCVHRGDDSQ